MRKIEFSELKLKNRCTEESFYQIYLEKINSTKEHNKNLKCPIKEYEIIFLNILNRENNIN